MTEFCDPCNRAGIRHCSDPSSAECPRGCGQLTERKIVLIPVDREDGCIRAMYEIPHGRREYRWWLKYARMGHAECRIVITTNDRLHELRTRCVPFQGTYLEAAA